MPTKQNSSEQVAAVAADATEVVDNVATLYTNGIERFAELQKTGIDLAVKQNAELLGAWKKMAQAIPGAAGLFDLASSSFGQYANTRKAAIDLFVEQGRSMAGYLREGAASSTKAIENAASIVQQNVDYSVAAQKKAVDYAAQQAKAVN